MTGRIATNVDVSLENAMYVKKIMFGILLHVVLKMKNIQQILWMIQRLCKMKLQNVRIKKQKLFQQLLMKRKQLVKRKMSIFSLQFY